MECIEDVNEKYDEDEFIEYNSDIACEACDDWDSKRHHPKTHKFHLVRGSFSSYYGRYDHNLNVHLCRSCKKIYKINRNMKSAKMFVLYDPDNVYPYGKTPDESEMEEITYDELRWTTKKIKSIKIINDDEEGEHHWTFQYSGESKEIILEFSVFKMDSFLLQKLMNKKKSELSALENLKKKVQECESYTSQKEIDKLVKMKQEEEFIKNHKSFNGISIEELEQYDY